MPTSSSTIRISRACAACTLLHGSRARSCGRRGFERAEMQRDAGAVRRDVLERHAPARARRRSSSRSRAPGRCPSPSSSRTARTDARARSRRTPGRGRRTASMASPPRTDSVMSIRGSSGPDCASTAFWSRLWNTWRRRVGSPWTTTGASGSDKRDVRAQIVVQSQHVEQEGCEVDCPASGPDAAGARRSRSRRPCASSRRPARRSSACRGAAFPGRRRRGGTRA